MVIDVLFKRLGKVDCVEDVIMGLIICVVFILFGSLVDIGFLMSGNNDGLPDLLTLLIVG